MFYTTHWYSLHVYNTLGPVCAGLLQLPSGLAPMTSSCKRSIVLLNDLPYAMSHTEWYSHSFKGRRFLAIALQICTQCQLRLQVFPQFLSQATLSYVHMF